MSAICGIFNMDGRPVPQEMSSYMMKKLRGYCVDDVGMFRNREIFLGSAIQYITPESRIEKLPFIDSETGLVIVADAIIDNRRELFSIMNISSSEGYSIPDSQLILMSYKKWGEECPKYLVGDFAFVIWNKKKKELFCARDHVGKRAFYFYHSSNMFAFCTAMKPLFCVSESANKLNDVWIADFLSFDGPMHEVDCNETVYEHIKQLLPAFTIKLNTKEMAKKRYWNPLDKPKLHFKFDEEYEEAFREVFFEAVSCRTRSNGQVGIMLSGGLDSGSVACVAARQLAGDGKRLQAFSSIPFSNYKNFLNGSRIADERTYIEAILNQYKNIDSTYCSSENKNSISNVDKFIDLLEQPYKFVENFFWLNEIAALASKRGCRVLLNGQFGNLSISFGDIATHLISLHRTGRWISILREIRGYSKIMNINSFDVAKPFINIILPDNIKKIYNILRRNKETNELIVPVNPELALKCNVNERFRKIGIGPYTKLNNDLDDVRRIISGPRFFSQIGSADTKMSLAYGLQSRDPSMDKRVIEFCFGVPGEQYVRQGQERSLIRRSMFGILPDKVRLNYKVRGLQSADWLQRLLPIWKVVNIELENMMEKQSFQSYIDINKVRKAMKDVGDSPKNSSCGNMRMIIVSLIFGHFLNTFETE